MAPDLKTNAFKTRTLAGAAILLSLGLSGCIDTLEQGSGARRPFVNAPGVPVSLVSLEQGSGARRPFVNAPGVPVSLVSLDGAPEGVTQRFEAELGREAGRRQIALVQGSNAQSSNAQASNAQGSETPRYRLKGYLSAYDVEGGTNISWVWDMYDTTEKRARRVEGAQLVKRNAAEPWSTVDDAVLQAAASNSMNEVASYLTGSPSPIAQAQVSKAQVSQAQVSQAQVSQAQLPPIESARAQAERLQASRVAAPPAASNRPQPGSDKALPSTSAFAATFDLPSGGARTGPAPAFGLLPQ